MEEKVITCYTSPMSEKWVRDTGLVFTLVALVFAFRGSKVALIVAAVLTLITMLFPVLLRPLAWLWFTIATVVSNVMQRVFLGLIFCIVVTPVALLRRMLKGDARDLSRDEIHDTSLVPMQGLVTAQDMVRPY